MEFVNSDEHAWKTKTNDININLNPQLYYVVRTCLALIEMGFFHYTHLQDDIIRCRPFDEANTNNTCKIAFTMDSYKQFSFEKLATQIRFYDKTNGTLICFNRKCQKKNGKIFQSNVKPKLRLCNGCRVVYYCSRKCQKIDWKSQHSKQCNDLANVWWKQLQCSDRITKFIDSFYEYKTQSQFPPLGDWKLSFDNLTVESPKSSSN